MSAIPSSIAERPMPGVPRAVRLPAGPHARSPTASRPRHADARPRARRGVLVIRTGAVDEPDAGAARRPRRARPHRGHRAPRRRSSSPRPPSAWARRSTPRPAGTPRRPGSTCPPPGSAPALELLAEIVRRPAFPEREVDRLRDERLNDLLQAKADPRRRAEEASSGRSTRRRARTAGPRAAPRRRSRASRRPSCARSTTAAIDPGRAARSSSPATSTPTRSSGRRGRCSATGPADPSPSTPGPIDAPSAVGSRFVRRGPPAGLRPDRDPDRPRGAAAPEPGLPRRLRDGRDPGRPVQLAAQHEAPRGEGLHVRRERGLRPAPRPPVRSPRAPPSTPRSPPRRSPSCWPSSTGSARRRSTDAELRAARDYLVGVFPLRFETPGPVAGSLAGLFVHGLPDDELDALPRRDRGRHRRRRAARRARRTSTRRRRPSSWSATTTSSAGRSRRPRSAPRVTGSSRTEAG